MKNAIEVLQNCTIEGNVVKLPNSQLDRKVYTDTANKLQLIGGKWKGGKVAGFVFQEDPTDLLDQIANGENRNIKKEYQFFGTPDALADYLVELAMISHYDRCFEPSAGQGALIKAINRQYPGMAVECCELMPLNQSFLRKMDMDVACIIGDDFLELAVNDQTIFDVIVANPPFSKNQDIDHIRKMMQHLAPGGRIVSIASKHWQIGGNKKEAEFRDWLNQIGAEIIEVPAGSFKESGTNIATCIIVIDNPL